MFQRLTSLFFGEGEEVTNGCEGPKPSVADADEEGWLLVNLPARLGEGDWVELEQGGVKPVRHTLSSSNWAGTGVGGAGNSSPSSPDCCRTGLAGHSPSPASSPGLAGLSVGVVKLAGRAPCPCGSTPPSPGSQRDCSSRSEPCWMDESWFVTPPPCFTAEGSTPETSPMEDLLIEHPSMSVYVATGNQSITEETGSCPLQEISQKVEPANPAGRGLSGRPARASAVQATVLDKICQVNRVQRSVARAERRQLSRNRVKRQNRLRENIPWSGGRAKGSFVQQPRQRQCNY
ncbi:tumor protein p53-inducible nuclear protein 2-like isoform X1 [Acipenser oxyrinchus oxyrinchus]|uniref:Tumor protein p53-inducible nuclear protein 2-like isoform X1 n=1 Tax=Acipenser oxyrinchus oxyrinchus TaxID=40147 RepID=A0AAD8FUC0_ACIOX|nr:tumor protein p53-inducible nuclear protein 2-like isoform X1 [Acipenser oxyrinchus oxyrinchus]